MHSALRPYVAILSGRMRTLLQYRVAALAGLATQFFFGLVRTAIFAALQAASTTPQPLDWPQTVTYIWLGQALFRILPIGPDGDVRAMVNNGTIAYELTRPLDLYTLWYSRAISGLVAPTLLRLLPVCLFAVLFMDMRAPASLSSGAFFLVSVLCAVLLGAAFVNLMSISLMWTISGEGAVRLMSMSMWILCGITLPIPFFPDWFQPVLTVLPFRGLMDTPFRIYVGHFPSEECPAQIGYQIIWIVALLLTGRLLLARGMNRLVVQGG